MSLKIHQDIDVIITEFNDGKMNTKITDVYKNYNRPMLNFIKTKSKSWFNALFDNISSDVKNGATKQVIINNLYINGVPENLRNRIICSIFPDSNLELADEMDVDVDVDVDADVDVEMDRHSLNQNTPIVLDDEKLGREIDDAMNDIEWTRNMTSLVMKTRDYGFSSGIYSKITDVRKTLIMFKIIAEYSKKHPNNFQYIIICDQPEKVSAWIFNRLGAIDRAKINRIKKHGIIDLSLYDINNIKYMEERSDKPTILITDAANFNPNNMNLNLIILDEYKLAASQKLYEKLHRIKYRYKVNIIGFSSFDVPESEENNVVTIFCKSNDEKLKDRINIISDSSFR